MKKSFPVMKKSLPGVRFSSRVRFPRMRLLNSLSLLPILLSSLFLSGLLIPPCTAQPSAPQKGALQGSAREAAGAKDPAAPPLFLEDFASADAAAGRWEEVTNGGSLSVSEHRLILTGNGGKGFPVLTTRRTPFPQSGDWTVSFGYRFARVGNYGTDLRCDRADGGALILIHQDVNGQVIALGGRSLAHMPPNLAWHVVSVTRTGPRVTAFVDGKEVGSDDMGAPPTAIRLGGNLQTSPWDWSDLQVQFVRVDAGLHPLSLASLRPTGDTPAAVPVSSAPGFPASLPISPTPAVGDPARRKAPVPAPSGDVRYKIVTLGAFPIALHTNWLLDLEITNDTGATVSAVGFQLDLLFGDSSKLPLTIYDPDKSTAAGTFLHVQIPALAGYDIKAHSKKVFHAYFFDSALISPNYYGLAHRAEGLIITDEGRRVAVLPVYGF